MFKLRDIIEWFKSIRVVTRCPKCGYYYPPVCTFYSWLPMTSRKGFCYHGIKGEYQGDIPVVSRYIFNTSVNYIDTEIKVTDVWDGDTECVLCRHKETGDEGFWNPKTEKFTVINYGPKGNVSHS